MNLIKLVKSTFYNEDDTKRELNIFLKKAKYLSFGKECERFEKQFAEYQGRKHCIFVNSGSSANLALIQALINLGKIKPNDSIGFSSLTWSTNVMPIIQLGLRAVPIDVSIDTLNISSKTLSDTIKKKAIKVLLLTNLLGFCHDLEKIRSICKKEKIILIEDNCESLGTEYKGKKLGNFGLGSTFSFYVGHHMSTIEGGAICTDNEKLATMLRLVRAHGWDRNLDFTKQNKIRNKFRVNSTFYSRYTFYDLGYNLRPTEISGFIGNKQIKYIDEIVRKRQDNFFRFAAEIYKNVDLYYPIKFDHLDVVSNFAFPIICRSKKIRDALVKKCEGIIEIRPIVGGDITSQPFFTKYVKKLKNTSNPIAALVHRQGLYFGNNPELTDKEIKKIISVFQLNNLK